MLLKVLIRIFNSIERERKKNLFPYSHSISISKDFEIGRLCSVQIPSGKVKITIMSNVRFREFCNILVYEHGELKIEENVFFNNYCSINCLGKVLIGENSMFGEGVKIYDHNHSNGFKNGKLVFERDKFKISQVTIGRNCWIGSNVTILPGVEIGDNVIIGANNLVYKSIPSNVVVKAKAEHIIKP